MDQISQIILTPSNTLIFNEFPTEDWRRTLFDMGAKRHKKPEPVYEFWRGVAETFLAFLCRVPESLGPEHVTVPAETFFDDLCHGAPPMAGGEYLSVDSLAAIWASLTDWTAENAKPSLPDFLNSWAPQWKRVGRVTFHLAENTIDSEKPFAFMATFVTSLTTDGRDRHLPLGQALKLYSEEKPALLTLLRPVSNASQKLPWVAEMVKSGSIYRPMAFSISRAYRLLSDVPALEESGLTVRIPDWWRKRPQVRVAVSVGGNTMPAMGLDSILDWDVGLAVGDTYLSPLEIQMLLGSSDDQLVLFKGNWLEVDRERLSEALKQWQAAKKQFGNSGLDFVRAMRLLAGLPDGDGNKDSRLPETGPWVVPMAGEALNQILNQLRSPEAQQQPPELKATLRPYQCEGLSWLTLLTSLQLGACLADDMGLGKTMQVLALLLTEKKRHPDLGASLLVAPASLLSNWKSEAAKFAPTLKVAIWHPSETAKEKLAYWERHPDKFLADFDLVITSYSLVARNSDWFSAHSWRLAILDEAQAIKNPTTSQSRAVKNLKAKSRLVLTGTPIENRLTDLWSLFDFLNPGLLSSLAKFQKVAASLDQDKGGDGYAPLRRLVSPYMLRRLKTDRRIINDLPDKIEITLDCHLTKAQAKLYEQVVKTMAEALQKFNDQKNSTEIQRRGLILQCLTRLRQVINHPAQLLGDGDWEPERSGKFLRLAELCREMAERQQKLLVFTQYREIIEPLAAHLTKIFERPGLSFHGGTKVADRHKLVTSFQSEAGPPFMILSLKAGGTGLNLTSAGQVIHFDRWWNPAVEDQATDRAYRIGQKQTVMVHKCVTRGTLEEKIDQMLTEKRELADGILGQEREYDLTNMDNAALLNIVSLDLDRAVL